MAVPSPSCPCQRGPSRVMKVEAELAAVREELRQTQEVVQAERGMKLDIIVAWQTKEAQLKGTLQGFEVWPCA